MSNTQFLYVDFWTEFHKFLRIREAKGWSTQAARQELHVIRQRPDRVYLERSVAAA